MPIWSKGSDDTNMLVHEFTVSDDYLYDRQLAIYDIIGCIAHATMLGKIGIISTCDSESLVVALRKLSKDYEAGSWTVEASDEDVHSKIEKILTERIGEPAKRLHTGRSRNDQVLTAVRLWQKNKINAIAKATTEAAKVLLQKAVQYEFHPLPGYTHLQRGMPSSVGQFFGAFATLFLDNLILLDAAYQLADTCPLGSGASYGVGLPLDRQLTSDLLGFERPVNICLADANGRGKVETATLDAIGAIINDLSRFAADMVFFTSSECGFFRIGAGFTTGSSIMPQKKNLDLFELMRGRASRFLGLRTALYSTTIGLYSGYNRDLQDTKALLIDGVRIAEQSLATLTAAVPTLEPCLDKIEAALSPDLYATDEAYNMMMKEGIPFREAYVKVGKNIDQLKAPDHNATVKSRTHLGSTGNLGLEKLQSRMDEMTALWGARKSNLETKWNKLLQSE